MCTATMLECEVGGLVGNLSWGGIPVEDSDSELGISDFQLKTEYSKNLFILLDLTKHKMSVTFTTGTCHRKQYFLVQWCDSICYLHSIPQTREE